MIDYRRISSFDTEERLPKFKKNRFEERMIQYMNEILRPIQKRFEKEVPKTGHLLILIVGVPRTGTTLLNQILASRLDIEYISNLMARFYEAPAVGAILQKLLIGDRYKGLREYKSVHGVTLNIEEPHEFGYFWARHLAANNRVHEPNKKEIGNIDISKLKRELNSITGVFNKSIVMKCPLGNFFISVLKNIKNIFFIDMKRDNIHLAASILDVRKERLGSEEKWWSLRPRAHSILKELPVLEQIAGQIVAIRRSIDRHLDVVHSEHKMEIHYEDLLKNPEFVLDNMLEKISVFKGSIEKVGPVVPCLSSSRKRFVQISLARKIEKAFATIENKIGL